MDQFYRAVLLADNSDNSDTISSYLDPRGFDNEPQLLEHSWVGFRFVVAVEQLLRNPVRVVWAGTLADAEPEAQDRRNLYARAAGATHAILGPPEHRGRYVINHDRRLFVDKDRSRYSDHGRPLHPLPLLTAEGYGRGTGENHPHLEPSIVGSWARQRISVQDTAPTDYRRIPFELTAHRRYVLNVEA
ncbi:hypothetical protein [Nocardia sp. NPDC050435]|uniref:hypothetical protein n=1 Tax=Nocardia sp. NPDC050435 TaxID=3155040 RepID=UPI0033D5D08B